MKFTAILALGLAQIAPAFGAYLCVMPNGYPNPSPNLCSAMGVQTAPGSPEACCITESQRSTYERGCKDNGGVRVQHSYAC
ncbi:hypothetical protein CPLU01_04207 [Colletotrichum plurivorum]|uniref:Uncharacterized protein n=1 Tax=Colletotrichum plurivorum TaxID=2175906 RepID=A0A8H6NK77_9PEZI|nr:hypothetical protein CPLU01_04207 [Colletotrichum plurivorum]